MNGVDPLYFADIFYNAWDIVQAAAGAVRHGHVVLSIFERLL